MEGATEGPAIPVDPQLSDAAVGAKGSPFPASHWLVGMPVQFRSVGPCASFSAVNNGGGYTYTRYLNRYY